MTKFAASSQMFSSNALLLDGGSGGGGGGSKISTSSLKRKTPSELRVIFVLINLDSTYKGTIMLFFSW